MSRAFAAIGLSALLCACQTVSTLNTPHAQLEKAETVAEGAYTASVPLMTLSQQRVAWADLQKVREAYALGQDITSLVSVLMADLPQKGS